MSMRNIVNISINTFNFVKKSDVLLIGFTIN